MQVAALLRDLAQMSDTTEVHPVLHQRWESLMVHLASFGGCILDQAGDLAWWYRREPPNQPS
jgi:hypothetical protein